MFKPIKRYRPERHYMRGPGPKWLEKHGGGINRVGPVMDDHRCDKHPLASFFFQLARTVARLGSARHGRKRVTRSCSKTAQANLTVPNTVVG